MDNDSFLNFKKLAIAGEIQYWKMKCFFKFGFLLPKTKGEVSDEMKEEGYSVRIINFKDL